jgi:ABC-type tungstate transport system permease subunit
VCLFVFCKQGLAVDNRTLHREGLLKLYIKKGKPMEDRYLFLFNDTILVMKPRDPALASKMKKLSMSGRVALDKTKIINISDDDGTSLVVVVVFLCGICVM